MKRCLHPTDRVAGIVGARTPFRWCNACGAISGEAFGLGSDQWCEPAGPFDTYGLEPGFGVEEMEPPDALTYVVVDAELEQVARCATRELADLVATSLNSLGDGVESIAAWLDGLESALEHTIDRVAGEAEKAELLPRRGIYSGVASDVRSGNWKRKR